MIMELQDRVLVETEMAMELPLEIGVSSSSISVVVSVLLATLIVYAVVVNERRKKLPPGPWPWPVVGNLPAFMTAPRHRSLQKLAAKHGGLMYLQLGRVPCLVISTAAAAREFFNAHDAAFASRPLGLVSSILVGGKTVASAPYGPYWRQVRRISNQELFSPARHASHEGVRDKEIRHMLGLLLNDSRSGKSTVNLRSWVMQVFANNLTRMLINKRYFGSSAETEQEKGDFVELLRRRNESFGAFVLGDYVPDYLTWITYKLQGVVPKFEATRDFGESVTAKIFELENHRHRAHAQPGDVPDFVDVMLNAPLDDGKPMADQDIMLLLLGMMAAGTDTSAVAVEWAMAELMVNPAMRKAAQEELDAVVGTERLVQESDILNFPYLRAIVKETFRLHPPVPLSLTHKSTQPCEVSGCQLPGHTHLILNIFAIHRDPDVYENPDEFEPRRFLNSPEGDLWSRQDSFQLLPFGAGRRMCPGYNLGNLMVSLLLAHLLHSFDWSFPAGQTVKDLDMSDTLNLVGFKSLPLCLLATPRSPAFLYEGST